MKYLSFACIVAKRKPGEFLRHCTFGRCFGTNVLGVYIQKTSKQTKTNQISESILIGKAAQENGLWIRLERV